MSHRVMCVYTAVAAQLSCPRSRWIYGVGIPSSRESVAKLCRSNGDLGRLAFLAVLVHLPKLLVEHVDGLAQFTYL